MSARQFFSESEKLCLQELIVKYKINLTSTLIAGNCAVKKVAWARLVEEYNSIETNHKRTESQLKKCWDNLKTRKKDILTQEKKERMKTGGGQFHPKPGPSSEGPLLTDETLIDQIDVELRYVVDSDNLPQDTCQEINYEIASENMPPGSEPGPPLQSYTVEETEPKNERDTRGRSGSRHTDYSASGQHTPGGAKTIRARVTDEEFQLRKKIIMLESKKRRRTS